MRLLLLLLLLLSSLKVAHGDDTILVCNGAQSPIAQALVDGLYKRYPPDQSLDCSDAGMQAEENQWQTDRDLCLLAVFAPGGPQICTKLLDVKHQSYVDACALQRILVADAAAGLNARVPTESFVDTQGPLYADYALEVDVPRSTMHSLDGVALLWTSLALQPTAANCTYGGKGGCLGDFMWEPPLTLLSQGALTLAAGGKTLALDGQSLSPDLTLSVPDGTLVRTTRPGSRDTVWAVRAGTGCGTLQMVVRVTWVRSTEPRRGASVGMGGAIGCWKRTMAVVRFDNVAMQCLLPYPLNLLRARLSASPRDLVRALLTQADWASTPDGQRTIKYTPSQADLLLECAAPSGGGIGGTWQHWSPTTPGLCVACTEWNAATLQSTHQRARACNRSLAGEVGLDCCAECRPGYMAVADASVVCAPWCRPGTAYANGGCWACGDGTYSLGGLGACQTCQALGVWNAYADKLRGCVVCDARSTVVAGACVACPVGTRVPPRSNLCTGCGTGAYYLPATGTDCLACPAGTFMDAHASTTTCQTCAANTISRAAATACALCPVGTRHSPNHTVCLPCPPLNAALLPLSVYAQPGCAVSCRAGVAYQRTSPLVPGGCANCSTLAVPIGRFLGPPTAGYVSAWVTCPMTQPCTNAPAHATYTGPSPVAGASQCPFACNAGYTGASCAPCALVGFNASVHQLTGGCGFTCKPFVYVDAALACRQPCVNLLGEALGARVRDYPPSRPRPLYVFNVCGTTQASPVAALPVLRRALWAFLDVRGGAVCGDAVLNTGETCDDGNAVAGDGCGRTCQVEAGLWDCDVIGAPCLPNCGWPLVAAASGDVGLATWGFILPSPAASCDGLRYADVRDLPDRLGWMRAHLVSCDCDGRPYRAVPYANCTAANRGCRICGAGLFHDDVRSVCVACGTTCAPGFAPAASGCGPAPTASNASLADRQLAIGCGACTPPSVGVGAVTYLASPCRYACRRGPGASQDTYCQNAADAVTGICSSFCRPCASALAALQAVPPPTPAGWYPQGCTDGVGYAWAPCDAAALPANAVWSTSATAANDARGCGFACTGNTLAWKGACLPCSSAASSCSPGQHLASCAGGGAACVPCEGALSGDLQAWTSLPPYTACTADCEPGVGFAAQPGGQCQPCTRVVCALGELLRPCVPRADAYCDPCPPLPDYSEFVVPGACVSRCASGYYYDAGGSCRPCAIACVAGFGPSKQCATPDERLSPPACVSCQGALAPGAVWGGACAQVCGRWMLARVVNGSSFCEQCDPATCGVGQGGTCEGVALSLAAGGLYASTRLTCAPCDAPPAGTTFAMAGLCTALVCLPAYAPSPDGTCVPRTTPAAPSTPAPATLVLAGGSSELPALQYPVRSRRHS